MPAVTQISTREIPCFTAARSSVNTVPCTPACRKTMRAAHASGHFRECEAHDLRKHVGDLWSTRHGGSALRQRPMPPEMGKYRRAELWGFEPQTSCMPSPRRTSAGVHSRRSPARNVHRRLPSSALVAVLPCCTRSRPAAELSSMPAPPLRWRASGLLCSPAPAISRRSRRPRGATGRAILHQGPQAG
jgi:hypothetical protein